MDVRKLTEHKSRRKERRSLLISIVNLIYSMHVVVMESLSWEGFNCGSEGKDLGSGVLLISHIRFPLLFL